MRWSRRISQTVLAPEYLPRTPRIVPFGHGNQRIGGVVAPEAGLAAGVTIIREGELGEMLYILEHGSAVATKAIEGGGDLVLREYGVGDFFGGPCPSVCLF